MQILFVHPNFPAQFAGILPRLVARGVEPVFVTRAKGSLEGVRCIRYSARGGATAANHYCSRTFENAVWNAQLNGFLRSMDDLRPRWENLFEPLPLFPETRFDRYLIDARGLNQVTGQPFSAGTVYAGLRAALDETP